MAMMIVVQRMAMGRTWYVRKSGSMRPFNTTAEVFPVTTTLFQFREVARSSDHANVQGIDIGRLRRFSKT